MEASDGLNPVSSQGYAEVQSVEARSMAKAGLIDGVSPNAVSAPQSGSLAAADASEPAAKKPKM